MNGNLVRLLRQFHEVLAQDRLSDAMKLMVDEQLIDSEKQSLATHAFAAIADGKPLCGDVLGIANDECQRAMLSSRFFDANGVNRMLVPELDQIASGIPLTVVTLLCHYANIKVPKFQQCSVVTSIRNEGPWLLEWVAHYIALGVKDIIIYHNDVDDGSSALIEELSRRKVIFVVENRVNGTVSPQKKAYNAACQLSGLLHRSKWAAFLDSDEFVWPLLNGVDTIDDCISRICELSVDKDRVELDSAPLAMVQLN